MTTSAILLCTAALFGQLEDEFYQDFRGGTPVHPIVRLFGPDLNRVMAREPLGLHIRVAADREDFGPVGVSPKFHVSGDFEITAGFQVISADPGYFGAGVNLRVMVGNPLRTAADLARYHWVDEGDVFFTHVVRVESEKQRDHDSDLFPTTARFGRLRLKRVGSTLHFLVAEEQQETFRELAQKPFVADDCIVRFVCYTGKGRGADVRLVDLRIRAERLPVTTAPERRRLGLVAWLLIALVYLATVCAAGYFVYRRR